MKWARSDLRRGLTLMEVLVVIVAIALLAAVFLPEQIELSLADGSVRLVSNSRLKLSGNVINRLAMPLVD